MKFKFDYVMSFCWNIIKKVFVHYLTIHKRMHSGDRTSSLKLELIGPSLSLFSNEQFM